jgi:D-alanyl-D-alanine carboxypeptidase
VVAKTGLLRGVVTLAGVTPDAQGTLKAFAILVNGPASTLTTRRKVDALAATVTGCW